MIRVLKIMIRTVKIIREKILLKKTISMQGRPSPTYLMIAPIKLKIKLAKAINNGPFFLIFSEIILSVPEAVAILIKKTNLAVVNNIFLCHIAQVI